MQKQPEIPLKKSVHALVLMPDKKPLGLTEVERKLFNVMLKISMDADGPTLQPDGDLWFHSNLKDMGHHLGMKRDEMGTAFYIQACRNLMEVVLEFHSPSESDDVTEMAKVTRQKLRHLVEKVDVVTNNGAITVFWRFDSEMEPYLLNPERFALLRLETIARLGRASSIALYEICARYVSTETGSTGWKPWEWWVSALTGTPTTGVKRSKTYSEFRYFNKLVVKPSIEEINEKTEITIVMETVKNGRNITDIRFLSKKSSGSPAARKVTPQVDPRNLALIKAAETLDVDAASMEKFLKKYAFGAVEAGVTSLRAALKQRDGSVELEPIRSNRAYLKGVLERMNGQKETRRSAESTTAPSTENQTNSVLPTATTGRTATNVEKSELRIAFESLTQSQRQVYIDQVIKDIEDRVMNSKARLLDKESLEALRNRTRPLVGVYLAPVLAKFNAARESVAA